MSEINKQARDSAMLNGTTPYMKTGGGRYGEGLRKQRFADPTRLYAQEIGEAASNVYDAMCQGVSEGGDWYDWRKVRIRVSPAATASTGETMPDDWMKLHIIKPVSIDTVPIGAYLTFAGNTWIVYKGKNMGSVIGDGIIRRCNSVIHVLDYYGNLVSIPMSYAKMGTLGNASHATENSIVAKNYISCICQLNEYSREFVENTRIILGKAAYSMRGMNDFTREFTDDAESVHLLSFTIERSAPLPQDSLEMQCADYESFRWDLSVNAPGSMMQGTSAQIQVSSYRNGKLVESSEEHPISYIYECNSFMASVDSNGVITARRAPLPRPTSVNVTVRLAQNPEISKSFTVQLNTTNLRFVSFVQAPPETLSEYNSAIVKVAVYDHGVIVSNNAELTASGPPVSCYSIEELDRNEWRVTAYGASNIPLTLTASVNYFQPTSAEIKLVSSEGAAAGGE